MFSGKAPDEGPRAAGEPPRLLVLTGLSGAGRSTGAKVLEDLGFYVIDNLPPGLLRQVVDLDDLRRRGEHLAVALGSRSGYRINELDEAISELESSGIRVTLVFLDATDDTLIRRYEEHRRPHPLGLATLPESIAAEREMMEPLRSQADLYVNTSDFNVHEFRRWLVSQFADLEEEPSLRVAVTSFGFKNGTPRDLDLMFDVRFLPNPYWVPELRNLIGTDRRVREHVMSLADARGFLERLREMLVFLIPRYRQEGKSYVSIGIGCTGGRHRSVALAEELGDWLRDQNHHPAVRHRDAGK